MGALQAEFDLDRLLLGDPTVARPTDPATSHAAAVSVSAEAREASEHDVLDTLRWYGPLTDEQIHQHIVNAPYNYSNPSATEQRHRTARKQLVDKGLVMESGLFGLTATGRRAIEWVCA